LILRGFFPNCGEKCACCIKRLREIPNRPAARSLALQPIRPTGTHRNSEDREDVENVEAWAEVIKRLLYLVPPCFRLAFLRWRAPRSSEARHRRAALLDFVVKNEQKRREDGCLTLNIAKGLKNDRLGRPEGLSYKMAESLACDQIDEAHRARAAAIFP
jgi:hypothetical protein